MIGMVAVAESAAHRLAHEQSVHARQHQIENHEIRRRRTQLRHDVSPRCQTLDLMPRLLEIVGDEVGNVRIVFDDED